MEKFVVGTYVCLPVFCATVGNTDGVFVCT